MNPAQWGTGDLRHSCIVSWQGVTVSVRPGVPIAFESGDGGRGRGAAVKLIRRSEDANCIRQCLPRFAFRSTRVRVRNPAIGIWHRGCRRSCRGPAGRRHRRSGRATRVDCKKRSRAPFALQTGAWSTFGQILREGTRPRRCRHSIPYMWDFPFSRSGSSAAALRQGMPGPRHSGCSAAGRPSSGEIIALSSEGGSGDSQ